MPIDKLEPDEVIALHFDEKAVIAELAQWCGGDVEETLDPLEPTGVRQVIWVPTVDGPQRASLGWWIVRRADGDFWPMSPQEFAVRAQPVPEG